MRKLLIILFVFSVSLSLLLADWNVGDLHKMGGVGPQLPDPTGYDVDFTQNYIGDDFECGEDGPIDQIHFWVSFAGDNLGNMTIDDVGVLTLQIWSDVPDPNPEDPADWSHPGSILWEGTGTWEIQMAGPFDGDQGYYNPWEPFINDPDHTYYYQLNLTNITGQVLGEDFIGDPDNEPPETDAYFQHLGNRYWLLVQQTDAPADPTPIGWKTSQDHWMDDAVFFDYGDFNTTYDWIPLNQHPANPTLFDGTPYQDDIDLAFVISGTDATLPVTLSSFDFTITAANTVSLEWVTETESSVLGFNIYRNTEQIQPENSLNYGIIDAEGNTSQGAAYSFEDETVSPETQYYYWLEAVDLDLSAESFGPLPVMFSIDEEDDDNEQVENIAANLINSYPNPFTSENTNLNIKYSLSSSEADNSEIRIYNIKGELVRKYNNLEYGDEQVVTWDGRDSNGKALSSGIYFYQLSTPTYIKTAKTILLK